VILLILGGLNYYFSQSPQGKSTLIFTKPAYLYLFWIVPVTYLAYYRNQRIKETLKKQYGSPLYNKVTSPFITTVSQFFLTLSICFIIIALAQPVFGKKKVKGVSKSLEIAICLDISNSMNVRDLQGQSRIEVAKRTIGGLINQLSGEKIGLCVFAGDAMVQLPLTSDYQTAQLFTEEIQSSYISNQGTNIIEALETSVLMFSKNNEPKCILMISDGEDHENQQSEIYNFIREQGGWNNWSMIEIEKYPCLDGNEARKRERYWFEQLKANLNVCYPNRSTKESKRTYYDRNKDETFVCECGKQYTNQHKKRHEKSLQHQKYLNQ
jgi:hypothetical protein